MRPNLDAALFADLRRRVAIHNESGCSRKVKLGELKKLYVTGYRGRDAETAGQQAMQKVDAFLSGLRKADDPEKHPRDQDGRFTAKGGSDASPSIRITLPRTEAEHRRLQEHNAGYRALTSDAFQTHNAEAKGNLIREAGTFATAAGIVGSLALAGTGRKIRGLRDLGRWVVERDRPGSVVERGTRAAGRFAGLVGGYAVGSGVTGALRLVGRGREAASAAGGGVQAAMADLGDDVGRIGSRASAAGVKAALQVARGSGLSTSGRRAFKAAYRHAIKRGSPPSEAKSYARVVARRTDNRTKLLRQVAAGTAMAGALDALAIRPMVVDSPADPAMIGRQIDNLGYRQIEKLASMPGSEELWLRIVSAVRDGATDLDLQKAFIPRAKMLLRTGQAILGGAVAGAGVGAAAHAILPKPNSGKRGNPYHDAKGHFTSRGNALPIGTALAGGLTAGATILWAMRRHNSGVLNALIPRIIKRSQNRLQQIASPSGYGHVADLIADRGEAIQQKIAEDEDLRSALDELDRFGGSSVEMFRQAVRDDTEDKIATEILQHDGFRPDPDGPTLGDIRAKARSELAGRNAAKVVVRQFVKTATPERFRQATETLPEGDRETVRHFFDNKQNFANQVTEQLAEHRANVAASRKVAEEAEAALKAASTAAAQAKTVHDTLPEGHEAKVAAKQAWDEAVGKRQEASVAHSIASRNVMHLSDEPPTIKNVGTGRLVQAMSETDRQKFKADLRRTAFRKAADAVDADIEKARRLQADHEAAQHNLRLASALMAGGRVGGRARMPARMAARPVVEALRDLKRHAADREAAERQIGSINSDLPALKRAAGRKKPMKGQTQHDYEEGRKAAADKIAALAAERDRLSGVRDGAASREAVARANLNTAAAAFEGQVGRKVDYTPRWIVRQLADDLRTVTRGSRDAASALVRHPGIREFRNFADAAARHAGGALGVAGSHAYAIGRDTFTREYERADGTKFRTADAREILRWVGTGGVGAGIIGALYNHGTAAHQALFGTKDERDKAHPLDSRHGLKIERKEDPITGEGYVVASVPHPDQKGDRAIVTGQLIDHNGRVKTIRGNTSLNDFKQKYASGAYRNQNQPQGRPSGGVARIVADVAGMNDDTRKAIDKAVLELQQAKLVEHFSSAAGDQMRFRADEARVGETEAGSAYNYVRDTFLKSGPLTGKPELYQALDATFSNQGQILKRKSAFGLLTGYAPDGNKRKNDGLLGDDGFASKVPEDVGLTLREVVDRVLDKNPPKSDANKAALRLAVGVIAAEKGVSADVQRSIVDKINGAGPNLAPRVHNAPASQEITKQAAPPTEKKAPASPVQASVQRVRGKYDWSTNTQMPVGWSTFSLGNAATDTAPDVAATLALDHTRAEHFEPVLIHLANVVGHAHPNLTENEAVAVVANSIEALSGAGPDRSATMKAIENGNMRWFERQFDDEVRDLGKAHAIDDLSKLLDLQLGLRKFDSEEARDLTGRFESGGNPSVATRVLDAGGDAVENKARTAARGHSKAGTPWYAPARVGSELGSAVGGELAWKAAQRYMPSILRATEAVAETPRWRRLGTAALKAGGRGGIGLLAGLAGSVVASAGGEVAARALTGDRRPAVPPPYRSAADSFGDTGGQLAGAILGGRAGPGWRGAVGGAIGMYAGGLMGRNTARYFSGYEDHHVKKAVKRYSGAPA